MSSIFHQTSWVFQQNGWKYMSDYTMNHKTIALTSFVVEELQFNNLKKTFDAKNGRSTIIFNCLYHKYSRMRRSFSYWWLLCWGFCEVKFFGSVKGRRMLWELLQSGSLHFLGFENFRKTMSNCRQEKHIFCSAAICSLSSSFFYEDSWGSNSKQPRTDTVTKVFCQIIFTWLTKFPSMIQKGLHWLDFPDFDSLAC